jgi:hypothetical protein
MFSHSPPFFQGNIVVPLRNEAGTGDLLVMPLFGLVTSLLIFQVARYTTKLSMIKKYQRSITESYANGYLNISMFIAIIIIYLLVIVGSIIGNVSIVSTSIVVLKPIFVDLSQPGCRESWYSGTV